MLRPLPFFLLCAVIATAQDVASISKKVSERYRNLNGYRVEGSYEAIGKAENGGSFFVRAKFLIEAAEKDRKLRVEFENGDASLTLITNGSATWTYLPKAKVYTRVDAATNASAEESEDKGPAGQNSNDALSIYEMSVTGFAGFEKFAARTRLDGEEELKTLHGKVRCWVLQTVFTNQVQKVWIDQQRYLALRSEATFTKTKAIAKVNIKTFELDSPEEAEFSFVPAKKDKLVDELHLPGATAIFVGRPAGDFALKNLEGETVRLAELRGKIVVLDFWATWCPPCRAELPAINRLSEKMKEKDVIFLGINDEGASTVKNVNKRNGYTFTTLEDAGGKVHRTYSAYAIPDVFIIGRDGVIVKHFVGTRGESELLAGIKEAGGQ